MLGNRYSQHSFAQVPEVNMARSNFNRSFTVKDAFDFDYLVPIFVDEIIPGDTCNLNVNSFARLATQKVPIMDNLYLDFFFFFVPNRLVWDNWERFCGAQDTPASSTDFTIPTITFDNTTDNAVGSIYDKLGLPTGISGYTINALPLRGIYLIWNTWFRDQNLQSSLTVPTDDGPDLPTYYEIQKRNKRHDYFTSSLPWPQKGPDVTLPLGTSAPVQLTGSTPYSAGWRLRQLGGATMNNATAVISDAGGQTGANPGGVNIVFDPNGSLIADLSTATAATINELREAYAVQALYEKDARMGTRYVEILLAHYNVVSPDFRLQRPEYLGGGSTRIQSHPVAQTSPTSGSNALAQLGAFGTASTVGSQVGFTKSFVEHGYVIGFACARADITYQQGLNKMWSRSTRFDFFWPSLQELGEQAVLLQEIYCTGTATDDDVWGYQERYAEYRYKPSEIHGIFRSTYATPIDQWHMAEEFGTAPALNAVFMEQSTPIERALAINTEPHLLFDCWFDYKHARPMVAYSVPSALGRF